MSSPISSSPVAKAGCGSRSCGCAAATTSTQQSDAVKLPKTNNNNNNGASSSFAAGKDEKKLWQVSSATADENDHEAPSGKPMNPLDLSSQGRHTSYCQILNGSDLDQMSEKCDAGPNATCCKERIEQPRHVVSHDFVRDVIIGLSDGLMVPFALTAGLSSLGSSKLVYQGGFAELISGAISMGIGGYLAAKAEQDTFRHKHREYTKKLQIACESEVEREVHDVLAEVGITQGVSRVVARSLQQAEQVANETAMPIADSKSTVRHRFSWRTEPVPTIGTTAFLLKYGEGMEAVPSIRLFVSAFTIGLSYFIGGLIPIIPYLCVSSALYGLYWSILATGIVLIMFGVAKSWFTGAATGPWGLIWGALSTLAVGAAAAAASYGVVRGLEHSSAA